MRITRAFDNNLKHTLIQIESLKIDFHYAQAKKTYIATLENFILRCFFIRAFHSQYFPLNWTSNIFSLVSSNGSLFWFGHLPQHLWRALKLRAVKSQQDDDSSQIESWKGMTTKCTNDMINKSVFFKVTLSGQSKMLCNKIDNESFRRAQMHWMNTIHSIFKELRFFSSFRLYSFFSTNLTTFVFFPTSIWSCVLWKIWWFTIDTLVWYVMYIKKRNPISDSFTFQSGILDPCGSKKSFKKD